MGQGLYSKKWGSLNCYLDCSLVMAPTNLTVIWPGFCYLQNHWNCSTLWWQLGYFYVRFAAQLCVHACLISKMMFFTALLMITGKVCQDKFDASIILVPLH